jgi:4-hydroxy-tetrahydrodipicolinate reductase
MLRVGIVGGAGKLGRNIIDLLLESTEIAVGAVIVSKNSQYAGCDIGLLAGRQPMGIVVADDIYKSADSCDVFVDSTSADALQSNLTAYLALKKPVIIATTGFGEEIQERICELSKQVPVVYSPNFSIGVYKFIKLVKYAAQELDADYDIEVIEAHHNTKKDKPSGTARKIAKSITNTRPEDDVPIHSIRAGSIVGEHTVIFANSEGEQIELSHRLTSRKNCAKGIVTTINWIYNKGNVIKHFFSINCLGDTIYGQHFISDFTGWSKINVRVLPAGWFNIIQFNFFKRTFS